VLDLLRESVDHERADRRQWSRTIRWLASYADRVVFSPTARSCATSPAPGVNAIAEMLVHLGRPVKRRESVVVTLAWRMLRPTADERGRHVRRAVVRRAVVTACGVLLESGIATTAPPRATPQQRACVANPSLRVVSGHGDDRDVQNLPCPTAAASTPG